MQPLDSSTMVSTADSPVITRPSMPISPISFMMTATGLPRRPWSSTCRSRVVFPLPRKPVRMSTATVCMAAGTFVYPSSSEVAIFEHHSEHEGNHAFHAGRPTAMAREGAPQGSVLERSADAQDDQRRQREPHDPAAAERQGSPERDERLADVHGMAQVAIRPGGHERRARPRRHER